MQPSLSLKATLTYLPFTIVSNKEPLLVIASSSSQPSTFFEAVPSYRLVSKNGIQWC